VRSGISAGGSRRVGETAAGTHSTKTFSGAPGDEHSEGAVFDATIVESLTSEDIAELRLIDGEGRSVAGERHLPQLIAMPAGASMIPPCNHSVYEVLYGDGYLMVVMTALEH
jgi:aromatic ring-opening dioxygenase LigB subunit